MLIIILVVVLVILILVMPSRYKPYPRYKDSELLACDVECRLAGVEGFYLELDIPGLDELVPCKVAAGAPVTVGGAR